MGKLTVMGLKNATTPGRYHDGEGLMLCVKPSGARSWVVRAQANGKRRDFGLGAFGEISLSEVRERARETRKQFKGGVDPRAAKTLSAALAESPMTFSEAAKAAHSDLSPAFKNKKHAAQWLTTLETYAFPFIGHVPVAEVEGPAICDTLAPIWLTIPETARRVRQRIGAVLDWACSKGLRQTEAPMRSINKGLPRQPKQDGHFAALPYSEAAKVYRTLCQGATVGRMALRFLMLCGARSGEVRGARWSEVDLIEKRWTIPAARMKAGREHSVPLSAEALVVLREAQKLRTTTGDCLIFPGNSDKPLSDMTLGKVLRSASKDKSTVHGLRSTFRDWATDHSVCSEGAMECALAHVDTNRVRAAYRRTDYFSERMGLMDRWSNFITS